MWNEGWIHPGEIVLFGSNNFSREPGEWIVLRTNGEEGTALIASVKSVGCVPYHKETNGSVSWDNCFLRIWLNKIFCNFFSDREKEAIREQDTPVSRDGRKTVRDRVFILSEAEAEQLLKDREERILYITHAHVMGVKPARIMAFHIFPNLVPQLLPATVIGMFPCFPRV